jgi:hypothetical protein
MGACDGHVAITPRIRNARLTWIKGAGAGRIKLIPGPVYLTQPGMVNCDACLVHMIGGEVL